MQGCSRSVTTDSVCDLHCKQQTRSRIANVSQLLYVMPLGRKNCGSHKRPPTASERTSVFRAEARTVAEAARAFRLAHGRKAAKPSADDSDGRSLIVIHQ